MSLIRHSIIQYAYNVNDIDTAIHHWVDMFGAGPFLKIPHWSGASKHLYRGEHAEDDVSHAHGQAGPVQIQLTQQHNDAPSIWRDMYPKGAEGLHHVAIMVENFEEERQRFLDAGCSIGEELEFRMDGAAHVAMPAGVKVPEIGRVVYMDARSKIGCFVEIFEEHPVVRQEFVSVKAMHDTWDGKTAPIRYSV